MEKFKMYSSLSVLQWFIFLLANSVALPVVIGGVFDLSIGEISALMQRTFLVVGLTSFLQAYLGHRYPIADGPAGSWVSVFVILADVATQLGQDKVETLHLLEGGMLVAGLLLILLGVSGYVNKLLFLFTPLVTGTFLFILALQLSGVFLKGMLDIDQQTLKPDFVTATIAIGVFAFVLFLTNKGKGWLRNYAVFLGILTGWLIYFLLGKSTVTITERSAFIKLPEFFAWGAPAFDAGIIVTAILFTLILVSNTIAAVSSVKEVLPEDKQEFGVTIKRGTWIGGISQGIASLFSTIGVVPLPVSAGFIKITGQRSVRPFIAACLIMSVISIFPPIVHVLALLPAPVASAALLASFVQMVGIAFQTLLKEKLDQRRLTIFGITLVVSIGIMFLPPTTFQTLPAVIRNIGSNGLLVGTVMVIMLEQFWKKVE